MKKNRQQEQTTVLSGNPVSELGFTSVVSNKLREFGIKSGDEVMVLSYKTAPASADDPYLERKYALVVRVEGGEVMLPSDNNDYRAYLVDPRNFESLSDERVKTLNSDLRRQFA